jgi:acetyl esterase/lipase
MTWADLLGREPVSPSHSVQWGEGATDIADLWLPDGAGPHPVVLMVHGGCWQKEIADRTLMNWAAEDLRKRGLAVWNIEYRGVDEDGGGYPGTFLDVQSRPDTRRRLRPFGGRPSCALACGPRAASGHEPAAYG